MRYTNVYNLPAPLENIAKRDDYSKGDAHISVTTLIDAPQVGILRQKFDEHIVEDVADRLWSVVGTAIHHVIEKGSEGSKHAEERLFTEIGGWRVSGAIDLQLVDQDTVDIADWKFTAAYSVLKDKIEWERQLNCYAHLVEATKPMKVRNLFVFAFIRDWSRREAERDASYPQAPIWRVWVKRWTPPERLRYMEDRVALHQQARMSAEIGSPLPNCSDDERWIRDKPFAVMKRGGKRALRVFQTPGEAAEFIAGRKDMYVQDRTDPVRCSGNYCKVSKFCDQWLKMRGERLGGEEDGSTIPGLEADGDQPQAAIPWEDGTQ